MDSVGVMIASRNVTWSFSSEVMPEEHRGKQKLHVKQPETVGRKCLYGSPSLTVMGC